MHQTQSTLRMIRNSKAIATTVVKHDIDQVNVTSLGRMYKQMWLKETLSKGIQEINLPTVVSECNNIGKSREWCIDTSATLHICTPKNIFSNYKKLIGEQLFMKYSTSFKVEG